MGWRPATCRPRNWADGARMFDRGVDRMRRLVCEYYNGFSFGKFIKAYPHLKGKVTDLLIGDLFTDRVDEVWGPLESIRDPGQAPIPTWSADGRWKCPTR